MLKFKRQSIAAKFIDPCGRMVEKPIEIGTLPITGRTSRIAFSRIHEKGYTGCHHAAIYRIMH